MSLKENRSLAEKEQETALAEKLLGIELESFDVIYNTTKQPVPSPDKNKSGEKKPPTK